MSSGSGSATGGGYGAPANRPTLPPVRIRAIAVFESVIYHCYAVDSVHPERPVLEVDAILRPGDADEGPLLLPVPTYMALLGGPDAAEPHLRALSARGRLVSRQGVAHIAFPTWTPIGPDADAPGEVGP